MEQIIASTKIQTTLNNLFCFHLDPLNIYKITPPDTKVKILSQPDKTLQGGIVEIITTKFFISTYWKVKIEKVQSPYILIDVALKSPFNFWKHQHIFIEHEDCVELVDIIDFKVPFGVLGIFLKPFIKLSIIKMFEYRHMKTKKILEC